MRSRGRQRRRVRFGVNYVPSQSWWYCWQNWHRDSIRRDLDDIESLRADHIRIQLLWPIFQPNSAFVSDEALAHLEELLDDAAARGLDVEVTVLDGQLSGFLFEPAFLIDNQNGRARNMVTDAGVVSTEKRLFMRLARRIGGHPAFLGFDISNEVYWFTQPLHMAYTAAEGDAWMESLLAYCERIAPGRMHVNGVDKWPYESSTVNGFTRNALSRAGAASCIHPWAGFGPIYPRYGPLSNAATHYAEFLLQYMQAFSARGSRTLWIEEDGCSRMWMPQNTIPIWAERSIRNAVSCDHLFGITWWCSHDVNPALRGFNRLEYDLGLYTNDRKLKPLGRTFRDLVIEFDARPPIPLARPAAMVIQDQAGSDDVLPHYLRCLESGIRPQIVLHSRAHDASYMSARGITRLIYGSPEA